MSTYVSIFNVIIFSNINPQINLLILQGDGHYN